MTLISAIQMTSTTNVSDNLTNAAALIKTAAHQGAKLIVLPEMFPCMGDEASTLLTIQEEYGNGPIQTFLATQAKQNNVWLVGGTIPIQTPGGERSRAACLVYDNHGHISARYDKIHLFDVTVTEGAEVYAESAIIEPGDAVVTIDTPFGKLGLAVCYDIRFPELFRCLIQQGAEIIAVPCAFTVKTGQAHWEALTRCRAIESLSYCVFACQTGLHGNKKTTYGHSMIIDPWGKVLTELNDAVGIATANMDLDYQKGIRQRFPALQHQRIAVQCDGL